MTIKPKPYSQIFGIRAMISAIDGESESQPLLLKTKPQPLDSAVMLFLLLPAIPNNIYKYIYIYICMYGKKRNQDRIKTRFKLLFPNGQ